MSLTSKVPVPAKTSINSGVSAAKQSTMLRLLGRPGALTRECSAPNAAMKKKMVLADVGPFRVTGLIKAVESLKAIFEDIAEADTALYDALDTEGMLCVRAVRGSSTSFSNHSWGTAIDIRIGTLDQYGSKLCASGLLKCYYHFHKHRWYWGAGFPKTDSMHFEASDELMKEWFA